MAKRPCRPTAVTRSAYADDKINVATSAKQAALWAIAASAPERFVDGCLDAPIFYLSEWPGWFAFRHSPEHRATAAWIVALAADAGIPERPTRTYTSSSEQASGRMA